MVVLISILIIFYFSLLKPRNCPFLFLPFLWWILFFRLAVDAVLRLKGSGNLDYIQVRDPTHNFLLLSQCLFFYPYQCSCSSPYVPLYLCPSVFIALSVPPSFSLSLARFNSFCVYQAHLSLPISLTPSSALYPSLSLYFLFLPIRLSRNREDPSLILSSKRASCWTNHSELDSQEGSCLFWYT